MTPIDGTNGWSRFRHITLPLMKRTLLFVVVAATIAFGIIFNGMAGFAFAKFEFKGKNLLFIIVMVTFMIPFELMSINLYKLMIDINWINTYWALIIPSISNGMVIFMFRQYFLGFPNYMIESAIMNDIFAASIIAFIIPILVILPLQKYFVEGITSTGTKE
jgi:ABC-type glycerol-3-phosphate transport system permease component